MTIQDYSGIAVLRDDLLPGGTKSVFIRDMLDPSASEYVYASPVYGGFQIALAAVCRMDGKKAIIFCAKRAEPHPNTLRCRQLGADIYQVKNGYLNVVTARTRDYCRRRPGAQLLPFGANSPTAVQAIALRCRQAISMLGYEPDNIVCAIGSGTLVTGILEGTTRAKIIGVQVGKAFGMTHRRLFKFVYPRPFDRPARIVAPFPSCTNYDLKAWEVLQHLKPPGRTLFWNVM